MVEQVILSSLRNGRYVLRASCTRGVECNSSWEIDINQTIESFGDITLTELRRNLRCLQCNGPIVTTLTSMK
jgi:hypothetical protein